MKIRRVSIKEAYKLWAKRYERDLPYLFEMESEKVIPLLGNVRGKHVLDLGCGTGRYSIALARKGAIVTAVDSSKEMIAVAERKAKSANVQINFECIDIRKKLPYPKESFDIVLSMLVLGHFKHLKVIFNKIARILRMGGLCIISTFHPSKKGKPNEKFILVQSLGITAKTYKQSVKEYFNVIKKVNLSLEKFLELKFPKKIIQKAKKEGVDLEPYSHKPFLMVFKAVKR